MKSKYELASIGNRFMAIVIDGIILAIITGLLVGAGREAGGAASFVVGLVYYWFFLTRQDGQTPGKRLLKVRVVKTTGEPLTFTDVLVRFAGYYINSFVFGLGWIWAFFDSENQGWHDKLAKTYVVSAD